MPVHIQLRRGLAAQWAVANPILAEGEAGVELDTGLVKVGDGINNWNALPYDMAPSGGINISAGTTATVRSDFTFSNSNGVSFGLNTGGVVTGSVFTNYQSAGAYLTTAMQSQSSSVFARTGFTTATTAGTNVVGTLNTNGLSMGVPAYLTTAAAGGGAALQGSGAYSQNTGTIQFANSNGVTFGLSTGQMTASVETNYQTPGAYLTTAALSQDSSKYAGTSADMTGGSVTLNTSGIAINLPAYLTTAQAPGAYLTTAMLSNAATISNINFSAGTLSNNLSALTFSDSNGISWGLDTNSVVTATVKTDYQSSGAYLTTAGLSQDSSKYAGTSTGMTGGSVTLNTSGIAINLPAYLTTAQAPGAYLTTAALSGQTSNFAGTGTSVLTIAGSDIAVTLNTTGLTIGYPAWLTTAQAPGAYLTTAALSGQTSNFAGTNTSILTTAGTDPVLTLNTTGLTLAYPKWITTYVNDLTSGRAGINTAVSTTAGTDITLGVNTSGVTIGYPKWITTYVNDLTSARAGINTAVSTTAGTDITLGVNTSGVTIGYPAWITTYVNDLTSARAGINTAISTTAGTDITLGVNTSGVTIGYPKWITTYVNDLTSARAGVNAAVSTTAGTDITLGVNTSGVTIGYPKWITTYDATSIRAGTATSVVTTGGTDLTMALNTGGLTVAYPKWLTTAAATNDSSNNLGLNTSVATTGGTDIAMTGNSSGLTIGYPKWITSGSVNLSAGTVSSSASQFKFVDSNGISFGLGTGTAAGLITATIASSLNVVNFSAGAASSNLNSVVFSNSNAFAFGLNASTITAGYPVQSYLNNVGIIQGTTSFSLQSNSLNVQPFEVPYPLSVSYIRLPVSFANLTSTTVGVTAGSSSFYYYQSINAVLYSQGAAANSRSLQYFASSQACFTEAVLFSISNAGTNESIAYQITYPKEGNNTDNSGTTMLTTAAGASIFLHTTGVMTVFTGIHWLDIPFATLLTPGNYWVAFNRSTSTTTSGGGIAITGNINRAHTFVAVSQINSNFVPLGFASAGAATASTQPNWLIGLGSHSVSAQGATTSSLALSSVSSVANFPLIPMQFIRQV